MARRTHQPQSFEQGWVDEEFHQARRHDQHQRLSHQERLSRNLDSESNIGDWRRTSDGYGELRNSASLLQDFEPFNPCSKGEFSYAESRWHVPSRGDSRSGVLPSSA